MRYYNLLIIPTIAYATVESEHISTIRMDQNGITCMMHVNEDNDAIPFKIDTLSNYISIRQTPSNMHSGTFIVTLPGNVPIATTALLDSMSSLGIGPGSHLQNLYSNGLMFVPSQSSEVSMVRNPNNPGERFCEPNSLYYVNNILGEYSVAVKTMIADVSHDLITEESTREYQSYRIRSSGSKYMKIDRNAFNELFQILFPNTVYDGEATTQVVLEDCRFHGLPDIWFMIGNRDDHVNFDWKGTIVYHPEDYLEKLTNDNLTNDRTRCILRVEPSQFPSFGFDLLSKVAIHFTQNQVGFCDPR